MYHTSWVDQVCSIQTECSAHFQQELQWREYIPVLHRNCDLDTPVYICSHTRDERRRSACILGCLRSTPMCQVAIVNLPTCLFAAEVLHGNSFRPASCITLGPIYFDSHPISVFLTLKRPRQPHKTALVGLRKYAGDKFSYKQVK